MLAGHPGLEIAHRPLQLEAREYGPLRVVFVGSRVAEIGEHAVTHVAGDVSLERFERRLAEVLIGPVDLAKVLGVEPLGELRGTYQVAEHHGQLTPLGARGFRGGRPPGVGPGGGRKRRRAERLDRPQQLLAGPEGDADLLQIRVAELSQDVLVDALLGKYAGVLLEADLPQPGCYGVHGVRHRAGKIPFLHTASV